MNPSKRIPVTFYRSAAGVEPVRGWLKDLQRDDRRQIGTDLMRVQEQWPIGMPICRAMGKGLWEVRSALTGNRIARMLFCFNGSRVVVLHAFIKSSCMPLSRRLGKRRRMTSNLRAGA